MTSEEGRQLIAADTYTVTNDLVAFHTSRCLACDESWFPSRERCAACGSRDVEAQELPGEGVVYACTFVRAGQPRFLPPYALAYVDVGPIRLLTHCRSEAALAPGTRVHFVQDQVGATDSDVLVSYVAEVVAS
ncbi:OB-fold domain-containing protein [Nocardioides sp. KIGAM211]|uniref:OB-fold domain-containing protein n=1 Tax=Nocardioides luti TaxID=2761101 RepID=A0A7X0RIA0_9ACTN|nr:OB-fold domain-containing protein [Nocardioides luti]